MSRRNVKKNSVSQQVRRAYRQDELSRVLTMPEKDFGAAFGMETTRVDRQLSADSCKGGTPPDYYHFKDNGSRVLAVAHLDTVVSPDRRAPLYISTRSGPYVRSGALDDRLGAYVILELLPKLGISCDQLLTVGEEDGESTASLFDNPGKTYDHVIEFDRGGTDVVMYQYDCRESRDAVKACGAEVGLGSFSDIAYLEHLGVKCFNWGAGYDGNYHSEHGYAYLNDTFGMVAKYAKFSQQNAGVAMPHEPDPYSGYDGYRWADGDGVPIECEVCHEDGVFPDDDVCFKCDSCQFCYMSWGDCLCYKGRAVTSARTPGSSLVLGS
jgi:hypothetical protein